MPDPYEMPKTWNRSYSWIINYGSNSENSKMINVKSRCKFNRATTATYRIRREWQIIEFLILNSRKRSPNGEFFDWNPQSSNASPIKPSNPVSLTAILQKLSWLINNESLLMTQNKYLGYGLGMLSVLHNLWQLADIFLLWFSRMSHNHPKYDWSSGVTRGLILDRCP